MDIRGSVRPGGLKRGVRTLAYYKAMGYSGDTEPGMHQCVGRLELDARTGAEAIFLKNMYDVFVSNGNTKAKIVLHGDDGKVLMSYGPPEEGKTQL